jgi:hypothetical protein
VTAVDGIPSNQNAWTDATKVRDKLEKETTTQSDRDFTEIILESTLDSPKCRDHVITGGTPAGQKLLSETG